MSSLITTARQVDPPVELTATYQLDETDRRVIDDQIRGVQQHLVDSLINGTIGTWYEVDGASADLDPGDSVCVTGDSTGQTVTLAVAATLAAAGRAAGVVLAAAVAGASVRVAALGTVSQAITGLAAGAAGAVRVNTTTGRPERLGGGFTAGDFPLGFVDASGALSLGVENPVGSTADHGTLTGLGDDDHTQYVLVDGSRELTNDLTFTDGLDHTISVASGTNGHNLTLAAAAGTADGGDYTAGGGASGSGAAGAGLFHGGDAGATGSTAGPATLKGGDHGGAFAGAVAQVIGGQGGTGATGHGGNAVMQAGEAGAHGSSVDGVNLFKVGSADLFSLGLVAGETATVFSNARPVRYSWASAATGIGNPILVDGQDGGTGIGGALTYKAGNGGTDQDGGAALWSAGDGVGTGDGANAIIASGEALGSGTDGIIQFRIGSASFSVLIGPAHIGVGTVATLPDSGHLRLPENGSIYALDSNPTKRRILGMSTDNLVLGWGTSEIISDGSKMAFYSGAPAAQPTDPGALTDSTGGSAGATLVDAGNDYGEISVTGNGVATAIGGATTWTQFLFFDTNGLARGATPDHTEDHITVAKTGVYFVTVSISGSGAGVGDAFEWEVKKNNNGGAFINLHSERDMANGADTGSFSISGFATLTAADTIELWVQNLTGTTNITGRDVTMSLLRIDNAARVNNNAASLAAKTNAHRTGLRAVSLFA